MAIVFDGLGFSVTIRSWQSFLISSIIRHITSYPLKGNIVRVSGKEGLSKSSGERLEVWKNNREGSRKLELERLMKTSISRVDYPC